MSKAEYDAWQTRQWRGMQNAWLMSFGNMANTKQIRKPTMTLEEWDAARSALRDRLRKY